MTSDATETTKATGLGWGALRRFLPYLWPKGEPALKARVVVAVLLVFVAKAATLIMPFAYKAAIDRMSAGNGAGGRARDRAGRRLCRRPLRRRAVRQSAQRHLRAGRPGCRAPARRDRVPPHPRSVAALPSRAADRRAHQDRRARHQEHRHDALFPAVQHRPDPDRADRDLHHLRGQVRPRPGRRDAGHGRRLYRLHPHRHRMAHQAAAAR